MDYLKGVQLVDIITLEDIRLNDYIPDHIYHNDENTLTFPYQQELYTLKQELYYKNLKITQLNGIAKDLLYIAQYWKNKFDLRNQF